MEATAFANAGKTYDHPNKEEEDEGMKEKKYIEEVVRRVNPAWLREKRKAAGITLRGMAKTLGFSAAFISDIELGRRNPNEKILKYLESL